MKKNNSMRAAGGLMIATMLTTSIVSGTYAKYVTSDSATDTARVAKFGVEVKAEGSLFGKNYLAATDNTPTDADTGITVKSFSNPADNVVAPGTKSADGLSFSITGTPEVDVNVKIEVADTSADIFLKEGSYPDMTTSAGDNFDLDADYYPIIYTLTKQDGTTVEGNLQAIKEALNNNQDYKAGANLADSLGNFTLTWKWAFEQGQDQADTLLGDLAAGTVTGIDTANYNLNTNIELTVSVTQVD